MERSHSARYVPVKPGGLLLAIGLLYQPRVFALALTLMLLLHWTQIGSEGYWGVLAILIGMAAVMPGRLARWKWGKESAIAIRNDTLSIPNMVTGTILRMNFGDVAMVRVQRVDTGEMRYRQIQVEMLEEQKLHTVNSLQLGEQALDAVVAAFVEHSVRVENDNVPIYL